MIYFKNIGFLSMLFLVSCTLHAQIAYYPFNGNANDVIAGNDAVVYGATLATDRNGNLNSAYLFDGVNDYMEVENPAPFNFGTDEFAVSLWIKPLNPTQAFQMIFQKGGLNGYEDPQYWLRLNDLIGSSSLRGLWGSGTLNPVIIDYNDTDLLYDGKWHHIIFQRTNEKNELYVDCVLVGIDADVSRDISGIGNLLLGAQNPNLPTSSTVYNFYSGLIDDVAFYDKAFVSTGAIDSLCLDLTTDTTFPSENPNVSVELYPIPASDKLCVDYRTDTSFPLHIEVVSNKGKVLIAHRVEGQIGVNSVELDVASLAAGHYHVRIYGANGIPQMLSFVKINP